MNYPFFPTRLLLRLVPLSLLLSTINHPLSTFAQGSAFTYQGRLNASGQPANGLYDLRLRLASDALGSNYVGGILATNGVPVSNGLFTVTIDFGAGPFTGSNLWLQVEVRTNSAGAYTVLSPLQQLTPAPYAIQAANATLATSALTAGTAGSIFATNIVGSISLTQLPGNVLTNNESDPVSFNGSLTLPAPATVYSGAALLLRSDPANRNFFAGGAGNLTLSGSFNTANGYSSMKNTTTGSSNTANGSYTLFQNTTGSNNTANGSYALFSNTSGRGNSAYGLYALGYHQSGELNTAYGEAALLYNVNDSYNTALGSCALYYITNGGFNTAMGESALANLKNGVGNIGIGYYAGAHLTNGHDNIYIGDSFNTAPGNPNETNVMRLGTTQTQTFIAGVINGNGGGLTNITTTATNLPAGVVTNNSSGVVLSGTFSGNGAGMTNLSAANVSSGALADTRLSTNVALLNASQAFTGQNVMTNAGNLFNGAFTGNGAGLTNLNATTLGGSNSSGFWQSGGNAGTAAGVNFVGTTDNQPLELKVNGVRALRLEPNPNAPNVIGGSAANEVTNGNYGAVIAGGGSSFYPNRVGAIFGTVVGGAGNTASANYATAMGQFNTASGYAGTAMGYDTVAAGFASQAGGTAAKANHDGAFVWADNTFADFTSSAANQFLIRAGGGVGINTNNPNGSALAVNGNVTVNSAIGTGFPRSVWPWRKSDCDCDRGCRRRGTGRYPRAEPETGTEGNRDNGVEAAAGET